MAFSSILIFLYIAVFATTWVVFFYSFPLRKIMATRVLMLLTFSFCVISFCTLNVYISQDFADKIFFSRLRFLGLAFLAPCWLLFISTVFNRWTWLQKKWALLILFLPALITVVLTLLPPTRELVVTDFQPLVAGRLSVVQFRGGPWFPFHIALSYAMVFLSYTLGFWAFCKGNAKQKMQLFTLFLGCFLGSGIDLYCIITDSPMRWMMVSGGTFLLTESAIVYAMFRYHLLDIVPLATEKVFQDFPDPILVIDSQGYLRKANLQAQKIFGLRVDAIDRDMKSVIPNLDPTAKEFFDQSRYYAVQTESIRSDMNNSAGAVISLREITAQKKNEMRLNENLDFKARLLAVIAHDLSGNIKNQVMLSGILQNRVAPEYQDHINMLQSSTYASSDLMSNILAWAKSQEAGFVPQKKRFEIKTLIRECLEILETTLDLQQIRVVFEMDNDPLIVDGDSEMIACVLRNLLTNAIRASEKGQAIYIDVEAFQKMVLVKIRDEGPGLSKEKQAALMKQSLQFFPGGGEIKEGYGIGLKIARRFIELHGGEFSMESITGLGTTVSFHIPI